MRYVYEQLVSRIDAAADQQKVERAELARRAGVPAHVWARKMRGDGSRFTLEEFGEIADALNMPPGWPFVDGA